MKKLLLCALTLTALSSVANAVCPTMNDQGELRVQLSNNINKISKGEGFTIKIQGTSPKATQWNVTVDQKESDLINLQDPTVNKLTVNNCNYTFENTNVNKTALVVTLKEAK